MKKTNLNQNKLWIGSIVCVIFTLIFMVLFLMTSRAASTIDISALPVLESTDHQRFYINDVSTDSHGTMYITGAAQNDSLTYNYVNWVLGPGQQVYKNVSLLLVDQTAQTAYKLKTYPYQYASENAVINEMTANGNGFIAYGDKKISKATDLTIAVMFEDPDKNCYILYPEEDKIQNEN